MARAAAGMLALAFAALAAGCGWQRVPAAAPIPPVVNAPLSTSLVTAQGTWAVMVMGGPAGSDNGFWQLFARPAGATRWSLATPEGVADNGGLVAAGSARGTSLVVGFRPSKNLAFSPLATSTDAGRHWTPGLLGARLADTQDALAVAPSGGLLALLAGGGIQTAPTAAAAAAGQWSPLTTTTALAASAPGRACGLVVVQAVSFGSDRKTPMAAGSCARPGVVGVFAQAGGTWQAAGPVLPAAFGHDRVQVLGLAGNTALLLAGNSLLAAWSDGTRWTVSAPVTAGTVRASGFGSGGSVWVLLDSAGTAKARAQAIAGPGGSWRMLPPVPAGTQALAPAGTQPPGTAGTQASGTAGTQAPGTAGTQAPGTAGTQAPGTAGTQAPGTAGTQAPGTATLGSGGGFDALAAAGSELTVWRLSGAAWVKTQLINVPITYGSSG